MIKHQGTADKQSAMLVAKEDNCTITYYTDAIVLQGQTQAIHAQAQRILKRFAYSPRPYRVELDNSDQVVLTNKH
jgi:hypothetical protein